MTSVPIVAPRPVPPAVDALPVLDAVPLPVVFVSWDGEVRYVNAAAECLLGRGRAELVGLAGAVAFPGLSGTDLGMALGGALHRREPATLRAYIPPAARWMEVDARPLGEGLAVFLRDLSADLATEAALRESEQWGSLVYGASSDAMFLMEREADGGYRCRSVNASYLASTGLAADQVVGRRVEELLAEPQLSTVIAANDAALAAGVPVAHHDELVINGSRVVLETTLTPVHDDYAGCTLLLGAARDVTARVVAEEERRRLEGQLQQAQKMEALGQLAGGVAHDFNNLLTTIKCNCELLADETSLSPGARADIEEISRTSDRAAALTRQLLAFSRKQAIEPRVVDLDAVIRDMTQLLGRLTVGDVVLATRPSGEPCRVLADVGQLEQVVMNLVLNARDAMPDGGALTVETRRERLDAPRPHPHGAVPAGRWAVLAVTDSGTGMDDATLAHLFEPFFTTKDPGRGTGLGLSTVYGIVSQFGGHVAVRSAPERGSTFTVYLPEASGA